MSIEVKRYHPALIALHWLLAAAILLAIGFGALVLDGMANDNVHKPGLLRMHLVLGALILIFTLLRLVVRVRTPRPAPLATGKLLADKLGVGLQHLMYALTIFAALAGLALAYSANLFAILYQHAGNLPENFNGFAAHEAHGLLAYSLLGAIVLHTAGALQQHFILKNGILSRMSFSAKN
jgi:cytochrome b561